MKTGKIFSAMVAVMRDIEAIGKKNRNEAQKFNFRGIDDVYNAVHPLFKKHGIFCTTEVLKSSREERPSKSGGLNIWTVLEIKITYYADDGSSVSSTTQGEGMDSGDKGSNKAMAVAQKYSIIQAFSIPTIEGSPDTDKDSPEAGISEEIKNQILMITDVETLIDWAGNQTTLAKNLEFRGLIMKRKNELKKQGQ